MIRRSIILFMCWVCALTVNAQQRLEEKKINLSATNMPLSEVVADLSTREGLSFTYGNTVDLSQSISLSFTSFGIVEGLNKIFEPCHIQWEIIGDQIVLSPEIRKFNFSGVLIDSISGTPLPYALVKIQNSSVSALSDFDGKFVFRNIKEGEYDIEMSRFAYKTQNLKIVVKGKATQIVTKLPPKNITLSETIVTSDKIIERASVSDMALNQTQVQWTKGISNDPLNSLSALPGVLGRIDIFGSSALHVRGGESFENQFLLDNIKLTFPFYAIGQSVFNPDMLEKAEVLTGGYSSNYGQSMSSVFNLTTKTGSYEKYESGVDLSLLNNSAVVQGPLIKKKMSFIVGLRKNNLDLLNLNDHSKAFFMGDLSSKLSWIVSPKTKVSLTTINVVDNLDFTHSPDFRLKLRAKNAINAQNFQVQTIVGKKAYSKTSLLHSGLNTTSKFGQFYYNTNNNTFGLREDLTFYLGTKNKIKAGAEFNLEDDQLNVFDYYRATDIAVTDTAHLLLNYDLKTKNVTSAIYAFYDGKFLKRFIFNAGGRIDYSGLNSDLNLSPRVTLGFELTRQTSVFASWGVFAQTPALYQLNQNKNLKANECQHSIVSIKHNLFNGLELRAEAYYKTYNNLVMFNKNLNFVNDGFGTAKGVELMLKKEQGNFNGWLTYAISKSERRRNLQDLSYPFYFDQRHALNAIVNYTRPNAGKMVWMPYSYSIDFRYASGTPFTPIVGVDTLEGNHVLVAGVINSSRNAAFNNINLKVVWLRFFGKQQQHRLQFYIDLWNVFSQKNLVVRQYSINKEQETINVKNNYSAGLYPNFGIKLEFNSRRQ